MNNFEKWKKKLTPEYIYENLIASSELSCSDCPAGDYCSERIGYCNLGCRVIFYEWARNDKPPELTDDELHECELENESL